MRRLPRAEPVIAAAAGAPGLRQARPRRSATALLSAVALLLALPLPAAEQSEPAPLAAQALLLDAARAGTRIVAVGDRGHVLLSDDEGRSWRQVIVPTRAMLTGVSFGDATHGWVVGHDGVILATRDAGETWARQDGGDDLETVWLDVRFRDAASGLAVGAYGRCAVTTDGGQTWKPGAPPPDELHLNQIAPTPGDLLYVAGEAGMLLSTTDAAAEWHRIEVPYDGSLYGTLALDGDSLLVYGLRGRVFASDDGGRSWAARETQIPVLICAAVRLRSGVIVLAGLGGNFHVSRDGGRTFAHWQPVAYTGGVSGLLEAMDGTLVVIGERGAARLQLPLK